MDQPPPEVLALVIGEQVYVEPVSKKLFLLGVNSDFASATFPLVVPRLVAYIVLTDGRGEVSLHGRVIDVDDENQPVGDANSEVLFEEPLDEVETLLHFADVEFPGPGEYRLQLFAD